MIAGLLKSEMGFTLRQLLYEVSYQNLILLGAAVPSYDFDKKKETFNRPGSKLHGGGERTKVTTDKTGLDAIIDTMQKALSGKR